MWDLSSYETASQCRVAQEHPTCLAWCGDCLGVGYASGTLRFVDAYAGAVLWLLPQAHKGDGCSALCAARDASFLVSGGAEGELRLWDVRTRKMRWHLKEHAHAVTQLSLFSDATHLLSASRDRTWCCVDTQRERRVAQYKHTAAILGLALLPDERRVLTAHADRSVLFWDLAASEPALAIADAHNDQINSVAVYIYHPFYYITFLYISLSFYYIFLSLCLLLLIGCT